MNYESSPGCGQQHEASKKLGSFLPEESMKIHFANQRLIAKRMELGISTDSEGRTSRCLSLELN